ncbi:MAG: TlpA disulfide reductase family protein [Chitinophaga rupis]
MKIACFSFMMVILLSVAMAKVSAQDKPVATGRDLTLTVDLTRLSYPVDKVYFTYYNTTTKFRYTDSTSPGSARISVFKTVINEPILAQLRVVPAAGLEKGGSRRRNTFARDSYSLYIEPGVLKAVAIDSLGNTTVTGSASHQDYLALRAKEAPFQQILEGLYRQYGEARRNQDSAGSTAIERKIDSVEDVEKEQVYKQYVLEKGQTSPVALYALSEYTGYSIDAAKAQPLYDRLGASVKALPAGIAFENRIDIARKLEVGQPAFDFTLNDTLGQQVSLSSFRGKYVLIDFWASWCGPCRAENPNVVKAFNRFKDRGFTILGVSLDRPGQKDKWQKAIHDDGLAWTQVSDLKFWDNAAARLYDVKAIPANFLVDRDGKIVARNVRGETLESTLDKLIK